MSPDNIVTIIAAGIAFVASLIAATVAIYNARFHRFASERWWERKAEAYARVVGSLVSLTYSLDQWLLDEYKQQADNEYKTSVESLAFINSEYKEAQTRIEHAAIEGSYILSERAANALSDLIEQLRREPKDPHSWEESYEALQVDFKKAQDCLKVIREEAKSELL